MLKAWGAQKRRAMTSVRRFADGGVHVDGWPGGSSTTEDVLGVSYNRLWRRRSGDRLKRSLGGASADRAASAAASV
jgi:hypothetical protein